MIFYSPGWERFAILVTSGFSAFPKSQKHVGSPSSTPFDRESPSESNLHNPAQANVRLSLKSKNFWKYSIIIVSVRWLDKCWEKYSEWDSERVCDWEGKRATERMSDWMVEWLNEEGKWRQVMGRECGWVGERLREWVRGWIDEQGIDWKSSCLNKGGREVKEGRKEGRKGKESKGRKEVRKGKESKGRKEGRKVIFVRSPPLSSSSSSCACFCSCSSSFSSSSPSVFNERRSVPSRLYA